MNQRKGREGGEEEREGEKEVREKGEERGEGKRRSILQLHLDIRQGLLSSNLLEI